MQVFLFLEEYLKETYGDNLCLIGNIDVSELLPFGTKDEVVQSVKKCIKDAGKGGGYILSQGADILGIARIENVQAMIQTVKKYGTYPINKTMF